MDGRKDVGRMTKKTPKGPMQIWGEKVNWEKRVKAVCKPCWEVKYCPYGPVVEEFPLKNTPDEKSCRVFGHDCPVFYVAEPLTETKELRNISRSIPRAVQFRVLKRDNQICSDCGKPVLDQDVEFDHIIPWSKGGPSDEHNVRLLCTQCNRKKGNRFEDTHLVSDLSEHFREPVPFDFVEAVFHIMGFIWDAHDFTASDISPQDFCNLFGRRKVKKEDETGAMTFNEIREFFSSPRPAEMKASLFKALKFRWGFADRQFHTIQETSEATGIGAEAVFEVDRRFVERLGFFAKLTAKQKAKWMKC